MDLFGSIRRITGFWPRREHDLDVTDQWLVRTLVRFRECTFRHLEAELLAIRGVPPSDVVASVLKLEQAGLVERKPVSGIGVEERRFRLTRRGKWMGALVPDAPRSPTIFYE